MTDFSHKQASEQIAMLYGVDAEIHIGHDEMGNSLDYPITEDSGAMFELAIMNELEITPFDNQVFCGRAFYIINEMFSDHNNDPIEATRVAIAKALIKKVKL